MFIYASVYIQISELSNKLKITYSEIEKHRNHAEALENRIRIMDAQYKQQIQAIKHESRQRRSSPFEDAIRVGLQLTLF